MNKMFTESYITCNQSCKLSRVQNFNTFFTIYNLQIAQEVYGADSADHNLCSSSVVNSSDPQESTDICSASTYFWIVNIPECMFTTTFVSLLFAWVK